MIYLLNLVFGFDLDLNVERQNFGFLRVSARSRDAPRFRRRYSHPVDRVGTDVICDQTGVLTVTAKMGNTKIYKLNENGLKLVRVLAGMNYEDSSGEPPC